MAAVDQVDVGGFEQMHRDICRAEREAGRGARKPGRRILTGRAEPGRMGNRISF